MARLPLLLVLLGLLAAGLLLHCGTLPSTEGSPTGSLLVDSLSRRPPEPIGQVRRDVNSDAVPDRVGDTVVVAGRVTAEPGTVPVPENGVGALQDKTGGIHIVFPESQDHPEDKALSRGDSTRVWGVLRHRTGLAQIEALGYEQVSSSRRVPAPIPLSVPSAAGERHEGRLAHVEGTVTARSANPGGQYFVIRETETASAQLTVFVARRHAERVPIGQVEEGDEVAVTGIVGQYDLSYQILPREAEDLSKVGQVQAYLWWALLGAGGLGLASFALIVFLRAAVRRRTRELEQSREELQEKESRLRSITENVSDGIYRSTPEEGLVYANQAFVDLFGYSSPTEMREIDPAEFYADPARRTELIEQAARQGRLDGVEVQYRRKDGTTFFGLLSTRRAEEEGGEQIYFDGAITDITEQRRREQALRERQEKIEALYESTRRLLRAESTDEIAAEIHGVLRDVFAYPFGHTAFVEENMIVPKKTTARSKNNLPHPEPRPVGGNTVAARALEAGEAVVVSNTQELSNDIEYGDLRSAAGVPIGSRGVIIVGKADSGKFDRPDLRLLEVLGGYAALVLDRLHRERALRTAKEEAETARMEAEKARDEAREAARLKSAFLANMSHEIRTPLTSIIGFSEALGTEISDLELQGSDSLERQAHLIEQGGKRLLETLEGVLNLSKLEAGQMELGEDPVDLGRQIQQAAEELRPKAQEAGVKLKTGMKPGEQRLPIRAKADEGGVQIVLRNLLSNAIKYTEEGGTVWVRGYRENGKAVLEVEDTGIGMVPEVAEDLFEPFRQASEGLGREYEGTGVGLSVTRKAAEAMGGSVEVETEKGTGSRFTVRLPQPEEAGSEEDISERVVLYVEDV